MSAKPPNLPARRGVVLLEACVSIILVGLVLGVVSLSLTRYARATDYFLNYRRAQLAAEACVERMRTGALELADAVFTDDAGLSCVIQVEKAEGDWTPLKRVRIKTEVTGRHGCKSGYELATFVSAPAWRVRGDE